MLGKVLIIQSFPPAILNCNAFLQNRILRNFRHGCYNKYMLLYTIPVIIYTLVLYTGRFRTLYLLINLNGRLSGFIVCKTWTSFIYIIAKCTMRMYVRRKVRIGTIPELSCAKWEFSLCPPIPELYRTILELRKGYILKIDQLCFPAQSGNSWTK